jgi:hypothetical protein
MKMNWKSFGFGFLAGVVVLSAIGYLRFRPQDVTAKWPDDDNKKAMKMIAPWVTEAKAGKLGGFTVFVPGNSSKTEAIMYPSKHRFPQINISNNTDICEGPSFSIVDAKNRAISLSYNESTGEFESYNYSNNIVSGVSFIDSNLDGQYDAKVGPGKSVALYYNSKWFPMTHKDKKKYLEIDGIQKEIEMKDFRWKFVGQ